MTTRSGGTPIKNVRKVKPGYDQEFTLQKGTSAAPIKQVKFERVKPEGPVITRGEQHSSYPTSPYTYKVPGTNIKIWESSRGWKAKGSNIDVTRSSLKEVKEVVVKKLK